MNRYRRRTDALRIAILLASLVISCEGSAKDFGIVGQTFILAENDVLNEIQHKLLHLEKSGKLYHLQKAMQEKGVKAAFRPSSIRHTTEYRRWEYDPTYRVTEAIYDHNGQVLHPKGTAVNPLTKLPMELKVFFIDGEDKKQVRWAIKNYDKQNSKIVLERGNPFELMKAEKIRFFFDQNAVLSKKLGIESVPAISTISSGKVILEEVVLP